MPSEAKFDSRGSEVYAGLLMSVVAACLTTPSVFLVVFSLSLLVKPVASLPLLDCQPAS